MAVFKLKTMSLFIISSMLFSCGGSSSDDNPTDVIDTSEVDSISSEENQASTEVLPPDKTMQSLVAPSDFLFINKENVTATIISPEHKAQRAYISVYTDYQQLPSGRFYPDGNTRIISGSLIEGQFEEFFISLKEQPSYLVEVWRYDGQDALQKEVYIHDNKLIW